MNKFLFATLATIALIEFAAAKLSFGRCPEPSLKAGFDKTQYIGVWYEYARDKSILFEYGDCSQAYYTARSDGLIGVQNSQSFNNKIDQVKGDAKCNGAHCKVKFFLFRNGDYRVLDTDYTTYSVVYSCSTFLWFIRTEYIWILTRDPQPADAVVTAAKGVMSSKVSHYTSSSHEYPRQGGTCDYLHE